MAPKINHSSESLGAEGMRLHYEHKEKRAFSSSQKLILVAILSLIAVIGITIASVMQAHGGFHLLSIWGKVIEIGLYVAGGMSLATVLGLWLTEIYKSKKEQELYYGRLHNNVTVHSDS